MIECLGCGSTDIHGVIYAESDPNYYDGSSEYECERCGQRYGRWTRRLLGSDEQEPKYGGTGFDPLDEFQELNKDIS